MKGCALALLFGASSLQHSARAKTCYLAEKAAACAHTHLEKVCRQANLSGVSSCAVRNLEWSEQDVGARHYDIAVARFPPQQQQNLPPTTLAVNVSRR